MTLAVAGDVCTDVLYYGECRRLSRETPGVPIVDIADILEIEGGAAVGYRQAQALGATAYLIPTGPPAQKSRLYASLDGTAREMARWDHRWPRQNPDTFCDILRGLPKADTLLYCQYRPTAPKDAILNLIRSYGKLRIGDIKDPRQFVGTLHAVKVSQADLWHVMDPPKPKPTPEAALKIAQVLTRSLGYRLAVVTLGNEGYVASSYDGATFLGGGLPGGHRLAGAGDIFTASLACALAAKHEVRDALEIANVAAGLASRKPGHIETVSREEVTHWMTAQSSSKR